MLQKRAAPFILDDVALPSVRRTQEEKHDAKYSSCHTGPDLADEGDGIKISKSATIRYQPEPLTKEELDFFLSLDFEADDRDTSIATGNSSRASFPLHTVLIEKHSANGLQDSSSTLQSNISSLSATTANAGGYHLNQSFSTLNTSSSRSSTHGSAFANQVQGQELKLISTMKRSAESRKAVQRMVRNFPPAPFPNAIFDMNTPAIYCDRNTCHPSGSGMNTIETKRKHEAMSTEKEETLFKEVRSKSVFDFRV